MMIDPKFCFEVVECHELPHDYAETLPQQNLIRVREDVYHNAIKGDGRARFTLAHELGHLLMHSNGVIALARNESIHKYMDPEWQANTFAGELLVNPGLCVGRTAVFIAEKSKVSLQVAEIQLSKK
ncbi:MAG: ImmA/IrrE family metallo-endopeptidase [Eubacteriaceae bacterium]|nr:ImmA/IrrE family metallo-endopeptidase [Eubacteriaceae bacterium]